MARRGLSLTGSDSGSVLWDSGMRTPEAMVVECSPRCSVNCSIYYLLFSYQRNVRVV